jgi:serine phosphatase RsbU (regulator of sigma subunit)
VAVVGYLQDWVLRSSDLLEALAQAIMVRGLDNEIEYANRAALQLFGLETLEELRRRTDATRLGGYMLADEAGNPVRVEHPFPLADDVQKDPARPSLVRVIDRVSGERRWWRFKSTPLHDPEGELIATITVIEDVTALKAAEARTQMLAESGRMLVSSLDYEQTLRNVAAVAVPELADWCAVDLLDGAQLRRVAIAPDGKQPEAAKALREFRAPEIDPDRGLRHVLRTGSSILYRRVTRDQLARWATSAAQLRLLQALDLRSVLIVPMRVPGRTIGAMTFLTASSRRYFGPEDQELAEQLGRRAAVAVENARLHSRLTDVAATLERSLLPAELPEVPGWKAACLYRPASSELRIDIGGDFVEVFQAASRWYAVVGDVEGKGVAAATMTALMRSGARFAAGARREPRSILGRLDEVLREHPSEATCTALCVRIESERLVLSSAGHPPALVATSQGEVAELPMPGPLLGAFDDARWSQEAFRVVLGDVVLLYTDGVTATLGAGRVGRDRLRALLAEQAGHEPDEIVKRLDAALRDRHSRAHADDLAVLVLARR